MSKHTVALLNIEPIESTFVGGKSKEVSIILGSFLHIRKSHALHELAPLRYVRTLCDCRDHQECLRICSGGYHKMLGNPSIDDSPSLCGPESLFEQVPCYTSERFFTQR
jgi:hypothetical protein